MIQQSARKRWLGVAALLGMTLVVAACGQPAATSAPTAAATQAQATSAATATPKPAPQKVVVAYTSVDSAWGGLFVAADQDLFKKHNVDVEVKFIDSGTTAMQALLAGQIDVLFTSGPTTINAVLGGAEVRMVAGILNTITGTVYASKDIKTPADLKGKNAAVSRFGSETDFAVRYSLRKFGLEPDKDVKILQIGSQTNRFAAIQSGQAHYSTALPPLTRKVKAEGYTILGELPQIIPEAQSAVITAPVKFIKERNPALQGMLKGYLEGVHVFKTKPDVAVKSLEKALKMTDQAALRDAVEYYGPLFAAKGNMTMKGIQLLLDESIKDPKAKSAKPSDFTDESALQALEKEGFFNTLK